MNGRLERKSDNGQPIGKGTEVWHCVCGILFGYVFICRGDGEFSRIFTNFHDDRPNEEPIISNHVSLY